MKIKLALVVAVALGLALGGTLLVAQQAAKPEDRVAGLIQDLDSNRFETRLQAHAELLKLGKPVVPALKKALADKPSLEVATRLKDIVRKLSVRDDAGSAAGDLQIRLKADKQALKPGETVNFTVTLFNLSEDDLNVQTGYTTCGNYFECGSAFRRTEAGPNNEIKEIRSGCRVGFCGTGAGPIFDTIPGEKSVEFTVPTTFGQQPKNGEGAAVNQPESPVGFWFNKRSYFMLASSSGGTQTLRVALQVAPGTDFRGLRAEPFLPKNPKAPIWSGTVQSNDVQIKIN